MASSCATGVSGTSVGHEARKVLSACADAALRSSSSAICASSRPDRPLDLVNRQAHDTGRQATAGQGAVGAGLEIGMGHGAGRINPMMPTMMAPPVIAVRSVAVDIRGVAVVAVDVERRTVFPIAGWCFPHSNKDCRRSRARTRAPARRCWSATSRARRRRMGRRRHTARARTLAHRRKRRARKPGLPNSPIRSPIVPAGTPKIVAPSIPCGHAAEGVAIEAMRVEAVDAVESAKSRGHRTRYGRRQSGRRGRQRRRTAALPSLRAQTGRRQSGCRRTAVHRNGCGRNDPRRSACCRSARRRSGHLEVPKCLPPKWPPRKPPK